MKYDFSGWATKNDLLCSDGRVIRKNAFIDNDGDTVPLVWQHQKDSVFAVLGHALLENRDEGVYAYCSFNDTESGKEAKKMVQHGDVNALSIHAGKLKQKGNDVLHGAIREVSLVLCGANPGARITEVIEHSAYEMDDIVKITYGDDAEFQFSEEFLHSGEEEYEEPEVEEEEIEEPEEDSEEEPESEPEEDEEEEPEEEEEEMDHDAGLTIGAAMDTLNEEQRYVADMIVGMSIEDPNKDLSQALDEADIDVDAVRETLNTFNDEQAEALCAAIGYAITETGNNEPENNSEEDGGSEGMKHNVFDEEYVEMEEGLTLSHADQTAIIKDARERYGSFKAALENYLNDMSLEHAVTDENGNTVEYGIADINWLFPEAKSLNTPPAFLGQKQRAWVATVMGGIHHNPFSRIKSMFADISMDEARALGYIKGHEKKNEVFSLLKRSTTPQTIYKKQKIDRDDVIDITDFDVIPWIRGEMRIKLDEEIARAILIGDGRDPSSDDHISEEHVRPIWTDDELFAVHKDVEVANDATNKDIAEAWLDGAIEADDDYEGGGNTILFADPAYVNMCLLLKDGIGHRMYKSLSELATAFGVEKIVKCNVMKNKSRTVTVDNVSVTKYLMGILVDLNDYYVGADKGGEINNFDDFDINFNQMIYLIETRISGALVVPKSAIVFEKVFQ